MKLRCRFFIAMLAAMAFLSAGLWSAQAEETVLRRAPSGCLDYSPWVSEEGMAHGTLDVVLEGEPGERYEVCFADDYGVLEAYEPILTAEIGDSGRFEVEHYFVPTAALPEKATRILAVGEEYWLECILPDGQVIESPKLYSFGLMSDTHVVGITGVPEWDVDESESCADYLRAVEYFDRNGVAFSIVAGDVTNDGNLFDYERYALLRQLAVAPVYHVAGNHEWRNDGEENRGLYTQYVEPNGECFTIEQDGDAFIFISVENHRCDLSEESMEFLAEQLEKYADRRVFIIEHAYVGSVGNPKGLDTYGNRENDDPLFRALLEEYPGATLITGHSHLHFDLQRLDDWANCAWARDGVCHRIHVPSLSRPRMNDPETEDITENNYDYKPGSLGYIVDVYEDYTIFRGIDFEGCESGEGRLLPNAQYLIPRTPAKK